MVEIALTTILFIRSLKTSTETENALKKLNSKNADMIVLNTLKHPMAGFGKDTNRITVFDKHSRIDFEAKSKREVAKDIVDLIRRAMNREQ